MLLETSKKKLNLSGKADILSIVFIFFFIALGFVDVLNGTRSFFTTYDNIEQFYPWYQKLNHALHQGYLPLWDANTFGGRCFSGEFQTGIFYPVNILWMFLFGNTERIDVYYLDLLVILHFFFAALGMYLVCRQWKISCLASIISGLLFATAGCVASRASGQTSIFFGLALVPYPFLFTLRYLTSKSYIQLFFVGFFLGMQILAGHIQPFFHTALLTCSYICFFYFSQHNSFKYTCKELAKVYAIIVSAVVVTSLPQLYTGLKYMSQAYRWVSADNPVGPGEKIPYQVYSGKFIIKPFDFFNIINQRDFPVDDGNDLFIGLILFVLIILTLYISSKRELLSSFDTNKKFFYWLMPITILIMLGHYTNVCFILYNLPFISSIRQLGRFSILLHFSFCVIVAFGFQYFVSQKYAFTTYQKKISAAVILLIFLQIGYLFIIPRDKLVSNEVLYHLFFLTVIVTAAIFVKNRTVVTYTAFISILLPLQLCCDYSAAKINSSYPPQFFQANKLFEYLEPRYADCRVLIESDKIPKNIGDVYNIQTKLGHGATMNKAYFDFLCQGWERNSEVNDLLNIKYIISEDSIDLPLIMRDENLKVNLYERPTAYPRLFLKSQTYNRSEHISDFTYNKIQYSDLYQKYEINSPISDTLIFSENYYSGWKIFIDSKRVDILKPVIANKGPLLMGIKIPSGKHVVELRYNCFLP